MENLTDTLLAEDTGVLAQGNAQIQEFANNAIWRLDAAGITEIILTIALPLLAIIVAALLNRWIDRTKKDSLHLSIADFMGPLLAPLLAVSLLMLAGFIMRQQEIKLFVLPFVWKVAVAWLAIRLVAMMSSRQSTGWVAVLIIAPITLLQLFGLWEPLTTGLSEMEFTLGKSKINAYGVLKSIAWVLALFWIAGFIVSATDGRLRRMRGLNVSNRVLIMKFFQIAMYFVVFLIGLQVLGVDLTAFGVLGGALGVGIGFGLQKIASNFISGIILLFEKSVQVDDLIELADGTTGFIRQTAARYSLLELADGREVFIPNEEFINARVTTLTHSNQRGRIEIPIGVAYGTDLPLARALLLQAAQSYSQCLADPAPLSFATGFADSAITMILYFWVDNITDGKNGPRSEVIIDIVRLFKEHGIEIPYPHQVQIADPAMEQRIAALEASIHTLKKGKA